eukprot:3896401-Heterocapsa_arctica.AAC.1
MDIPSYYRGASNAKKKDPYSLPDNSDVRKLIWRLQKGLASMGCVGSGDSEKEEKFGSLRIITSYRKDVDQLVREYVPGGELWDKKNANIHEYIKPNGQQSLNFLQNQFKVTMENLIGEFSEYSA